MSNAICSVPVQIYDQGLEGLYEVGDVIEGSRAKKVLARYPKYFVPEKAGEKSSAKEGKK